jgi:sortase B
MLLKSAAIAAKAARILLISVFYIIVMSFICAGIYMLWRADHISSNAFLSEELKRYSPENTRQNGGSGSDADSYSLEALSEINSDVIGWIHIYGTNIDHPLLQGDTDMEYLNKDAFGNFSLSGSVFLSSVCSSNLSDPYNIIYAHHMENGAMFGELDKFADLSFFEAHKEGAIYLTDGSVKHIEFFSFMNTDAYDENVFSQQNNMTNEIRLEHFKNTASIYFDPGHYIKKRNIVSLVTCSDSSSNGRTVLTGYIT